MPTIRYYERRCLIAPGGRSEGNQRRYGRDMLNRLALPIHKIAAAP